ncbi:MAG TPA: hypothetical protein PLD20_17100 [Blastocatellia bacterium]|nr:hypothetical protein [Blastocatellia bacterium]HMX24160.1 hypothetical protein [Blastocatellia bacterium]HMZ19656.1 hypothetical protein [Blastocatellia bacterium]HNG28382.1 hypothetical protein [Blastocatellia bacterium]
MRVQLRNLRKAVVFVLLFALGICGNILSSSAFAAGNPKDEKQVVGQLAVTGSVTVNDKKAINGTSIFNNSRLNVACANGNRAIINLGKLGRVEMAPGTQMVLKFSDGIISGDLTMGKVVVNAPAGVKVAISTPEGVSAADGKDASVVAATTQRGVRCVPVVVSSQSSSSLAVGSGALAAILLGAGGAAVAGAVVSSQTQASNVIPK